MRVSELKKGDLLFPISGMSFLITKYPSHDGDKTPWLRVVKDSLYRGYSSTYHYQTINSNCFMIYLGTKKDTGSSTTWSNRFCLIGDEIVAVDPSSWKRIQKESR